MKITINQIHSIGDILFCEPIARALEFKGYEVNFPVRDHLIWLNDYLDIELTCLSKSKIKIENIEVEPDYIPLRFANQIIRNLDKNNHSDYENMMLDKYELCNIYYDIFPNWKTIKINFKEEKAKDLYNLVNLFDKTEYVVINNNSQAGNIDIKVNGHRIIQMHEARHYTLIDWYYILSNAKEIHTVSTSILFLLQGMYNKGIKVPFTYIYPRPNEDGNRGIKNLNFSFDHIKL